MKKMTLTKTQSTTASAIALVLLASGFAAYAAPSGNPDLTSKAPNFGSIVNTRHNLTQSYLGGTATRMDDYRNNYEEVCVYCHTPHGANNTMRYNDAEKSVALPLWNRTIKTTTYTTYNSLTLSQKGGASAPGANSLTCLSCHDGTVAIDSIINMPGSGGYDSRQMNTVNMDFLNGWKNAGMTWNASHVTLGSIDGSSKGCTTCHDNSGFNNGATDFRAFVIGTDLRDDHPVGVKYPSSPDFNDYQKHSDKIAFFDNTTSGSATSGLSKDDIRLYNTGEGYEVECASCHDPHGVPSAGENSMFINSFLRKSNAQSAVCTTCHVK